jgi:hypothetical protein
MERMENPDEFLDVRKVSAELVSRYFAKLCFNCTFYLLLKKWFVRSWPVNAVFVLFWPRLVESVAQLQDVVKTKLYIFAMCSALLMSKILPPAPFDADKLFALILSIFSAPATDEVCCVVSKKNVCC